MSYEIIKFENENVELEVNVSPKEETVWLSLNEMCLLFDRDKSVISRHIKKLFEEKELNEEQVVVQNATTAADGKTYNVTYYNLDVILSVGRRIRTKIYYVFYEWAKDTLALLKKTKSCDKSNIIRFEKGNMSLDVTVVPEDETVYLSKDQLVLLFDSTRQNVEYHINNIYETNELERNPTCKEILQVRIEGNREVSRYQTYYNLEMIISLGYRTIINS